MRLSTSPAMRVISSACSCPGSFVRNLPIKVRTHGLEDPCLVPVRPETCLRDIVAICSCLRKTAGPLASSVDVQRRLHAAAAQEIPAVGQPFEGQTKATSPPRAQSQRMCSARVRVCSTRVQLPPLPSPIGPWRLPSANGINGPTRTRTIDVRGAALHLTTALMGNAQYVPLCSSRTSCLIASPKHGQAACTNCSP
jgi:hypothetical protein